MLSRVGRLLPSVAHIQRALPFPSRLPGSYQCTARFVIPSRSFTNVADSAPTSVQIPLSSLMAIIFTCKKCETRSHKAFTRQSYEKGIVLVRCPGCHSYHLISDAMGRFGDTATNIEEMLQEKGETVKRLAQDGLLSGLSPDDLPALTAAIATRSKLEEERWAKQASVSQPDS